ncbi:MAG: flippase-like domain-containing protein [Alphaproteobacteria bacterium]|nr:flippase-like domain-containing protein [Alphaproteobacteria bacterium]
MKFATYVLWALGLFFVLGLIGSEGFDKIGGALSAVGWGMLWVSLYRFVPMLLDAVAWRQLFPAGQRPPPLDMLAERWVGESVNSLLPVAQVGGDVVRARLAAKRHGLPRSTAGAATVVDFTLALLAHAVFSFAGLGLLLAQTGFSEPVAAFTVALLVGALLVSVLHMLPRLGLFGLLARLVGRVARQDEKLRTLAGGVHSLDQQIVELHRRGLDVFIAFCLKLAGWALRVFETWLIMRLMGYPIGWDVAYIIESLTAAVRSASFFMPGGLGLQEGGIMLLGHVLGIPPNAALGLAVVKRVRELMTGLPGLVAWSYLEHRKLRRLLDTDENNSGKNDIPDDKPG